MGRPIETLAPSGPLDAHPQSSAGDNNSNPGMMSSMETQQRFTPVPDANEDFMADRIWQRLQMIGTKHLKDVMALHQFLNNRSPQNMAPEQQEKLKHYKDLVSRMIPYLSIARDRVPSNFTLERAELLEKQITQVLDTFKKKQPQRQQQSQPQQ